jgi:DNA-binding MurR/RpiR family transcriptional regulator
MTSSEDSDLPFMDFEALRAEIERRQPDLPKRLGQLASYALDNPDKITFGTVASISADSNVPPSTVVRFAQSFGFNGFLGLQRLFRERLRERSTEYVDRMTQQFRDRAREHGLQRLPRRAEFGVPGVMPTPGAPLSDERMYDLFDGFLDSAQASVDRVRQSVPPETFRAAVDVLSDADVIYLIAKRRSFPISSYMAYAFGKLGVRYQLVSTQMGLDAESLAFAGPRDAAFAASFSPYTSETVLQARAIAGRGVPLVSMTDSNFSPLVEISKVWLEVAEVDFAGFRLLSASMALVMALTVAVADRRRA